MRTEQGIERQQAEAPSLKPQSDLDTLPAQRRQALAKLDADHHAAQILAGARADSARSQTMRTSDPIAGDAVRASVPEGFHPSLKDWQ